MGRLASSMSRASGVGRTLGAEETVQQIIFFSFSLNWWSSRAYTNGLTAELNKIAVLEMTTEMGPMMLNVTIT